MTTSRPRIGIFHNLGPGGALRAAFELARHSSADIDFTLHRVAEPDGQADAELDWGSHVSEIVEHRLSYPGQGRFGEVETAVRLGPLLELYRRVGAAIDERGYSALLVHHCWYLSSPSFLPQLRTPSVFYVQEPRRPSFEYDRRPAPRSDSSVPVLAQRAFISGYEGIVRRIDVRSARAATEMLCNSRYSAESIKRAYGRNARYCPLGVDANLFRSDPREQRDDYVIAVGALDPVKGADLVVTALGLIPESRRPALLVVGNRVTTAVVERLRHLGVASGVRVLVETGLSDADLARRYARARATIAAAELEPFGLTTIESLACGTPVVAVAEGGYREVVVDGVTGITVDRDPAALASGIDRVLLGEIDLTREHLRAAVIRQWTWDRSARIVSDALHSVARR